MSNVLRTGAIWKETPRVRAQVVRRVCEALEKEYGRPRLGNPEDPLDDLVYIVVSNATSPQVAQQTYWRVKNAFSTWDEALNAPPPMLQQLLRPAGLSNVKSQQIRAALQKIRNDFGCCDLAQLQGKPQGDIQDYLVSLPGVREKVAKCVMMYTMGASVLPVDRHVHRISRRLGWTVRKRWDECHEELEALVPPHRRYPFHVDCVSHGRSVCNPKNPVCGQCCTSRHCEHFQTECIQ
jgi:endonuclease III